jgi:hypothetical protein
MTDDLFDFTRKSAIVSVRAPPYLKSFAAHALHQATRFQRGEVGLNEAVDGLRFKAVRYGLVASYGTEEVEWIIGYALAEVGVHYGDIRPKEGVYP